MTGRQLPGQGHCSNRRQLNSGRKGHHNSHPRVQTVQAGQGPGDWTRRRALGGCQCIAGVAGAPSRPRYDISYPISTKSLISKRERRYPYIRHCTDIMYDIKIFTFDIVIFLYCNTILYSISNKIFDIAYISSVQRPLKFNIVPDIESFSPMSKSNPSISKVAKTLELERPQYSIRYRIRY